MLQIGKGVDCFNAQVTSIRLPGYDLSNLLLQDIEMMSNLTSLTYL